MIFTVSMETGNDAYQGQNFIPEIVNTIGELASYGNIRRMMHGEQIPIKDVNGNRTGFAQITLDDAEKENL